MGLLYIHSLGEIPLKHCFTRVFYEATVSLRLSQPIHAKACLSHGASTYFSSEQSEFYFKPVYIHADCTKRTSLSPLNFGFFMIKGVANIILVFAIIEKDVIEIVLVTQYIYVNHLPVNISIIHKRKMLILELRQTGL